MNLNLGSGFKTWWNAALSFFYPEVCQYCGEERAVSADGFIGASCREKVIWIKPPYCDRCGLPFEGEITTPFMCSYCQQTPVYYSCARAAVVTRGMVLDLIHRYKYSRALWLEPFLAGLLVQLAAPALCQETWTKIVPVPLHRLKESEREFNQAERLARHLSAATQIPLQARILKRVEPTRSQTRLSREERAANVRHAFAVPEGPTLQGERIVLVDDVLTTGATTNACARVLREAGADEVCIWTVARGLLN